LTWRSTRGILAEDLLGPPGNLPLAAASLSECQTAFMIGWPAVQCTQTRKSPACRPRDRASRSRDRDSRSRPNRETGDFPIPDSGGVGNRGFPPRFPAKSGIGGTGIASGDFRVCTVPCLWADHGARGRPNPIQERPTSRTRSPPRARPSLSLCAQRWMIGGAARASVLAWALVRAQGRHAQVSGGYCQRERSLRSSVHSRLRVHASKGAGHRAPSRSSQLEIARPLAGRSLLDLKLA
jgi:hypothetical protein